MVRSIFVALLCILLALPSLGHLFGPGDAGVGDEAVLHDDSMAAPEASRDLGRLLGGVSGEFVENRGQVANADVRYYAQGDTLSLGFTTTGVIMTLRETRATGLHGLQADRGVTSESLVIRLNYIGCKRTEPRAAGASLHECNFYIGNEPDRWLRAVGSHAELVYGGLYPGIDLRFRFKDGLLKYEFIVAAGADPTAIRMKYEGVESISVDTSSGEMLVSTSLGTLRDSRPMVLQTGPSDTVTAQAGFLLHSDGSWGFSLPAGLVPGRPFTIDPGLQYCSYLGGSGDEWTPCIARADDGGFLISTLVYGPDFPNETGKLGPAPQMMALCKLDSSLTRILFSTFFGGTSIGYGTWLTRIHLRSDGNAVLTGFVDNETFPTTTNALFRTSRGGAREGIIVMLSGSGELLYSSFIGGSGKDSIFGSCVDDADNLYVTFNTDSTDIATTPGAFCTTAPGSGDVVLCKLDSALTTMIFCTYLGGTSWEVVYGCAVDAEGDIFMSGNTGSRDFPFTNPLPPEIDSQLYVLKMESDGSEVLSCVGFGGEWNGVTRTMTLSPDGNIIIIGDSITAGLPLKKPIQPEYRGNGDVFVVAFDNAMENVLFSSYLGGSMADYHAFSTAWDRSKDILYISGFTDSDDFPTTSGCYDDTYNGGGDCFIFGINVSDYSLAYSTFLGGGDFEISLFDCLETGADGSVILVAAGLSMDVPCTPNAMALSYEGGVDLYLIKIDPRRVTTPGQLQGLKVESFGDGFVTLGWSKFSSSEFAVSGYRVYRGSSPEFEGMRLLADVGTNLSYNNTDLVNGREYYYRVTVVNSAGEGPPGEAVLGMPMDLPGAPVMLPATTGNGTVLLTWLPPLYDGGRIVGYRVWRGSTDACPDLLGSTDGALSLIDANVTAGTYYYYRAQAYNELGGGNLSEYERIKAIDVPTAPIELTAAGGPGEVVLAWKEPASDGGSPLLGYSVYRGTSVDGLAYLDHLLPGVLTFRDSRVVNGTTYYYRMYALSGAGLGRPSEVASAMPYGPPSAVGQVSASGNDGSILVEWAAPASDGGRALTGYKLYAGPAAGGLTFLRLVAAGTSATHAIENGVTWYFAVSAVNEVGEGPASAVVWATAMGPPSAPTQLRAQKLPGAVVLTWARPTDDGGSPSLAYRVLKGTSADALAVAGEVIDALSWTDADVELGGTYYYTVLAVNKIGNAGPRTDVIQVYMADVPGAPTNLTAVVGDGTVRLSWAPPTNDGGSPIVRYIILRGADGQTFVEVATVTGHSTEYLNLGLRNTETYRYAIQAENEVGVGEMSAVVNATPMPPPGKPVLKVELKEDEVVLTWTSPSGETSPVTGYIVYRGPSRERLIIIAELGLVLTYTDKDFERGKTYYYSVSAVSGSGEGAPADPVRFEVEQGVPMSSILIVVLVFIIIVLLIGLMVKGRASKSANDGNAVRSGNKD